ncbi:Annexin repeat [Dillenia turbinata]|uniref:Annexin repeat n=1 Tax=Dillenia turbinata TaxID=194707 RepID=A0AAN8W9L8_9MAGN
MATKDPASTTLSISCQNDCKEIHDSWGRLSHLAQALASRSKHERRQIRETYKEMYGENLIDRLQITQKSGKKGLIGIFSNLCEILLLWMLDQHERDVVIAREAIEQEETNYKALVEIFVGRKSSHFLLMNQVYAKRYKRQLEQDINDIEPPHPYQRILVALAASQKAHYVDVSQHVAKCDARRLFETGEGRAGSLDENVVLEILSKRSISQFKQTLSSYKHIYGHDYTKAVRRGSSCEFEEALKMVIKCLYKPYSYYAKTLNASIKSMVKDDGALARVLISRAEVDIEEIQKMFKKKYGMELRDAICERVPSGDYRNFLAALVTSTST